jgi:hypothetical protein
MPLSPANADTVASNIVSALGLTGTQAGDATAKWKKIIEELYSALITDITVTIAPGTIATAGSPTAQVGPPAPVVLVVS